MSQNMRGGELADTGRKDGTAHCFLYYRLMKMVSTFDPSFSVKITSGRRKGPLPNVALDPLNIGFLGARAIVSSANITPHLIEKSRTRHWSPRSDCCPELRQAAPFTLYPRRVPLNADEYRLQAQFATSAQYAIRSDETATRGVQPCLRTMSHRGALTFQ